ncbi:MAG: hypothetical protein LBQ64_00195 [Bacteroidales bacterium]|jgi:hypothetical protein|nr:hypothetical protein [Bacteroidales bacterium]
METFLEILKITLPALFVGGTAFFTLKLIGEKELKKQLLELKYNNRQITTPIRLQSYERLALLLERMKPNTLLLRNPSAGLSSSQYRTILLTTIRNEFDHNLSQQVYVSSGLWKAAKNAKEEAEKIINLAAAKTGIDAQGNELAAKILEIYLQNKVCPFDDALSLLHHEIKALY